MSAEQRSLGSAQSTIGHAAIDLNATQTAPELLSLARSQFHSRASIKTAPFHQAPQDVEPLNVPTLGGTALFDLPHNFDLCGPPELLFDLTPTQTVGGVDGTDWTALIGGAGYRAIEKIEIIHQGEVAQQMVDLEMLLQDTLLVSREGQESLNDLTDLHNGLMGRNDLGMAKGSLPPLGQLDHDGTAGVVWTASTLATRNFAVRLPVFWGNHPGQYLPYDAVGGDVRLKVYLRAARDLGHSSKPASAGVTLSNMRLRIPAVYVSEDQRQQQFDEVNSTKEGRVMKTTEWNVLPDELITGTKKSEHTMKLNGVRGAYQVLHTVLRLKEDVEGPSGNGFDSVPYNFLDIDSFSLSVSTGKITPEYTHSYAVNRILSENWRIPGYAWNIYQFIFSANPTNLVDSVGHLDLSIAAQPAITVKRLGKGTDHYLTRATDAADTGAKEVYMTVVGQRHQLLYINGGQIGKFWKV
jgi:hypothetical protein